MTVTTTLDRQYFDGDGSNKVFPFNFRFFTNDQIYVSLIAPDGTITPQFLTTNYTLAGALQAGGGTVTMLVAPPLTVPATRVFVQRILSQTQPTSIRNQGKFYPEIHEDAFDRLTMLIQQALAGLANALQLTFSKTGWNFLGYKGINVGTPTEPTDAATKGYVDTSSQGNNAYTDSQILRTVRGGAGENLTQLPPAASRANKVMGFDASGNPIGILPASGSGTELAIDLANSVDPAKGAGMVGLKAPNGSASTVFAELKEIDLEYARAAWATLAGNLQTGPMSVKAGRYLRNSGLASDDTYNDLAYRDILAGLRPGSEVEHPKRGQGYLKGGYEITTSGIHLRGSNSRNSYDQFLMRFTDPTVPAFKAKQSGFSMTGILMHANAVGRATNATQDAIEWDVTLNAGHADSVIDKCGFLYFRAAASVRSSPGRNIRFTASDFSNCRHIFSMEYPVVGPEDQRVFEFTAGCKAHSMGRLEAGNVPNPDDALFYFNPLSQSLSLVVSDLHADDSTRVFRGFVGQSSIKNVDMTRARGCIADIDATGFSQPGYETFSMANMVLMNIGTTSHQLSGIKTQGPCIVSIDGIGLYATGGHGLDIGSNNTDIRNAVIHNSSMGASDQYSGLYIANGVIGTTIGGTEYNHGVIPLASTTAKWAVENYGVDTAFIDPVLIRSLPTGKTYFIDPSRASHGPDPIRTTSVPRVSYAGAPPTTGLHTLGDLTINVGSGLINYGWRCTAGGTPGTWISIGRESA